MKYALFKIEGMSCHHCVMAVRRELEKFPVQSLEVKLGQAEMNYDESKVSESLLIAAIESAGYKVV